MAMAALAGCGGVDEETDAQRARPVDARMVAAIPDPLQPGAPQAPGTYVGAVGDGARAIALVIEGDEALVYLCDGATSDWLGAQVEDGRIAVTAASGDVIEARVEDGRVTGTVGGEPFTAEAARGGTGLYAGPDPALPGYTRRWIVLPDGVRGVSTTAKTSGSTTTPGSGSLIVVTNGKPGGTSTPATPTPPPGQVTDGTSNTILVGEEQPVGTTPAAPPPGQIADGTSNTIIVGEERPVRTTATPPVTDGTSNTIIVGEERPVRTTTTPPVTDGTSNTIVVGESPTNGVTGDGQVRTEPAPSVVVTTVVPAGKSATATLASTPPKTTNDATAEPKVAGGDKLACAELAKLLIAAQVTVKSADKARAAEAAKQLAAVEAQRKQNGC